VEKEARLNISCDKGKGIVQPRISLWGKVRAFFVIKPDLELYEICNKGDSSRVDSFWLTGREVKQLQGDIGIPVSTNFLNNQMYLITRKRIVEGFVE